MRKAMRWLGVLTMTCLLGSASVCAAAPEQSKDAKDGLFSTMGLRFRAWFPVMDGQVKLGKGSSEMDLKDTLGMGNKELNKVDVTFGKNKWRFGYEHYSFSGQRTLTGNYVFDYMNFVPGEHVYSELDLKYLQANYLPGYSADGDTNFTWVLGVKAFKMHSLLELAGTPGKRSEHNYRGLVPAVGVRYEAARNRPTSFYGEFTGINGGSIGHAYDFEVGFQHRLSQKAMLSGGYRAMGLHTEKNDTSGRVHLKGPFAQLEYTF